MDLHFSGFPAPDLEATFPLKAGGARVVADCRPPADTAKELG